MNKLIKLRDNLKSINSVRAINTLLNKIYKIFESEILDLNISQLWEKGQDSTGRILRSEFAIGGNVYSTRTIIYKSDKGQPIDRVTLKDDGDFYQGFILKVTNSGITITSTDSKTGKLVKVWGRDIFGLNKENMNELIEEMIKPELKIMIYDKIFAS